MLGDLATTAGLEKSEDNWINCDKANFEDSGIKFKLCSETLNNIPYAATGVKGNNIFSELVPFFISVLP